MHCSPKWLPLPYRHHPQNQNHPQKQNVTSRVWVSCLFVCLTAWLTVTPSRAQDPPPSIDKNSNPTAPLITHEAITIVNPRLSTAIPDGTRNQWIIANQTSIQSIPSEKLYAVSKGDSRNPDRLILHRFPQITAFALSPDSQQLLVAGGSPAEQGGVCLYHWQSKQLLSEHTVDAKGAPIPDVVTDVQWSEDGKKWIEAHWSGKVIVRDQQGNPLCEFNGHIGPVLTSIFWNSEIAISAGTDQSIKVWSTKNELSDHSNRLLRSLDNHTAPVTRLMRFQTENGQARLISCSQDQTIRLWDPSIGRMIRFMRFDAPPTAINITKDNTLLVATEDAKATLWSLPNFEHIQSWKLSGRTPRAIAFDAITQSVVGFCAQRDDE